MQLEDYQIEFGPSQNDKSEAKQTKLFKSVMSHGIEPKKNN